MLPVRRVARRGRGITGVFPSIKMGRMINFESLIERDLVYLLDYEPQVVHFLEQPITISYEHLGKRRKYTPDFHAALQGGRSLLFECKPQQQVDDPENQLKFSVAQQWCCERGWEFVIVTDEQLAANWRLKNVKLLTQFARYTIPTTTKERIFACLVVASGPIRVGELLQQIHPEAPRLAIIPILHLAFHRAVHIPLDDAPITDDSPVTLPVSLVGKGYWLA